MTQIELIKIVNQAWNWTGFIATKICMINEFGNIIFQTRNENYYRICPEELKCKKIADNKVEFELIITNHEFQEDWKMDRLVNASEEKCGNLHDDQKYCLKIPAVMGGEYLTNNITKITFKELISNSGELGFQIKDLADGQKIEFKIQTE